MVVKKVVMKKSFKRLYRVKNAFHCKELAWENDPIRKKRAKNKDLKTKRKQKKTKY